MSFCDLLATLRAGDTPSFPADAASPAFAQQLDTQDPLAALRDEFLQPSREMIKSLNTETETTATTETETLIYFCGNSLGLQPKATRRFVDAQLNTWAGIAVHGHFAAPAGSPLRPWQHLAGACAAQMAPLVGASADEVVAMNSLTTDLHLLLASFYQPTATRHKILVEWKPFPSDAYAVASQLRWHGRDVMDSLVELRPDADDYLSTDAVLAALDAHSADAALVLLPGVQYYTGQLLDMPRITAHARRLGIVVGWDLAHAVGNVELHLHDWDVDFAVWCTYKYLNAGPGAIAGAFVHERHGRVEEKSVESAPESTESESAPAASYYPNPPIAYRPRLSGWYGNDIRVRFDMANAFRPTPGAQGFQLSNPSALDLASLTASLSVFDRTSIGALRDKSLVLTAYADALLRQILADATARGVAVPFHILTPARPDERGAQLSVRLRAGSLTAVTRALDAAGIILDHRKPDVIRIAPVPLYNTFSEVCAVVAVLRGAVLPERYV